MSTKPQVLSIGNYEIDVVRKDIKNIHLAVYPPSGRIRLAAPHKTDSEVIRLFAISKIGWIKKHIKNFKEQHREAPRVFVSGESHYIGGKRYLLKVIEHDGFNKIHVNSTKQITMYIRPSATSEDKESIMKEWYRKRLKSQIPGLLEKWQKIIGVEASDWGVKQMRTKWGTCNIAEKRIWINLELAKKPKVCLEYIVVHELVHLLERKHNDKFVTLMNKFMPKWRSYRDELNQLPISNSSWEY